MQSTNRGGDAREGFHAVEVGHITQSALRGNAQFTQAQNLATQKPGRPQVWTCRYELGNHPISYGQWYDGFMHLNHLRMLEAEGIHIIREVVAEFQKPVMLYSIGKDSSVMLRLAQKAFYPAPLPVPVAAYRYQLQVS